MLHRFRQPFAIPAERAGQKGDAPGKTTGLEQGSEFFFQFSLKLMASSVNFSRKVQERCSLKRVHQDVRQVRTERNGLASFIFAFLMS